MRGGFGTSKSLLASVIILSLVILLFYPRTIYLRGRLEDDPPSVFNTGNGGVSIYFQLKAESRGVRIIYSLDELGTYDPGKHVLFIIGPDRKIIGVKDVADWVERGGVLILMDESNNTLDLAKALGVSYGALKTEVVAGNCTINGRRLTVLFNVYRQLEPAGCECKVICRLRGAPVAVRIRYGSGVAFIIGDSSLVINDLYIKNQTNWDNGALLDEMIGDRRIIVYEGARNYTRGKTYGSTAILSGIADLTRVSASVLFNGSTIDIVSKISGLLLTVSIIIFTLYGLPRSPYMVTRRKGV